MPCPTRTATRTAVFGARRMHGAGRGVQAAFMASPAFSAGCAANHVAPANRRGMLSFCWLTNLNEE